MGTLLGYCLWDKISLPFSNPYGIVGPLSLERSNPNNDLVRFVLFVSMSSLLLFVTYLLVAKKFLFLKNSRKEKKIKKVKGFPFLIIVFSILLSLTTPTHHASGEFDSYHEGESIGLAVSYVAGKIPYKEISFSHGVFLDPLRSVFAMKIFGKSIGATRAMMSIVKIISFVLLGLLIFRIYQGNITWSLLTLILIFVILPSDTFTVLPREFITFSYLLLLIFLGNTTKKDLSMRSTACIGFFLAYIPILSFFITVDRAFYLTALYVLLLPIIFIIHFRKKPRRALFVLFSILGLLAGFISLIILMKGGFADFISFVFHYIPRTKELSDGIPFSLLSMYHLTAVLLICSIGYWISTRMVIMFSSGKNYKLVFLVFTKKYFSIILLFLIAVFCFRSALGRSDDEHIRNNLLFPILGFTYIIVWYYLRNYLNKRAFKYLSVIVTTVACGYILILSAKIYSNNSIIENFPIYTNDNHYTPSEYKKTISYLRQNLQESELVITLTSEASWYYFIDQPCPIRFPIVHFAVAQIFQEEIISDIKQQNIRFILYKNKYWANNIDSISNEKRLPILYNYIHDTFSPLITLDGNEIWERNVPFISFKNKVY